MNSTARIVNHIFLRIVSLLLVPCLLTDVTIWHAYPQGSQPPCIVTATYRQEALAAPGDVEPFGETSSVTRNSVVLVSQKLISLIQPGLKRRGFFAAMFLGATALPAIAQTVPVISVPPWSFPPNPLAPSALPKVTQQIMAELKEKLRVHRTTWLMPNLYGQAAANQNPSAYFADLNQIDAWVRKSLFPIVMPDMLSHGWIETAEARKTLALISDPAQERSLLMDSLYRRYFAHYSLFFEAHLNKRDDLLYADYELREASPPQRKPVIVQVNQAVIDMDVYELSPSRIPTVHEFNNSYGANMIMEMAAGSNQAMIRTDLLEAAVQQRAEEIAAWMRQESLFPENTFQGAWQRLILKAIREKFSLLSTRPTLAQIKNVVRQIELDIFLQHEAAHIDLDRSPLFGRIPAEDRVFVQEVQADLAEAIGGPSPFYSLGDTMRLSLDYRPGTTFLIHGPDLVHVQNRVAYWFLRDRSWQRRIGVQLPEIPAAVTKFSQLSADTQAFVWPHLSKLTDNDLRQIHRKVWDEFQSQLPQWSSSFKDIEALPPISFPAGAQTSDSTPSGEGSLIEPAIVIGLVLAAVAGLSLWDRKRSRGGSVDEEGFAPEEDLIIPPPQGKAEKKAAKKAAQKAAREKRNRGFTFGELVAGLTCVGITLWFFLPHLFFSQDGYRDVFKWVGSILLAGGAGGLLVLTAQIPRWLEGHDRIRRTSNGLMNVDDGTRREGLPNGGGKKRASDRFTKGEQQTIFPMIRDLSSEAAAQAHNRLLELATQRPPAAGQEETFRQVARAAVLSMAHPMPKVADRAAELVLALAKQGADWQVGSSHPKKETIPAMISVFRKLLMWLALPWGANGRAKIDMFNALWPNDPLEWSPDLLLDTDRIQRARRLIDRLIDWANANGYTELFARELKNLARTARQTGELPYQTPEVRGYFEYLHDRLRTPRFDLELKPKSAEEKMEVVLWNHGYKVRDRLSRSDLSRLVEMNLNDRIEFLADRAPFFSPKNIEQFVSDITKIQPPTPAQMDVAPKAELHRAA